MADVGATYSLMAIPWSLSNGEKIEHLEYVLFVATDGIQTHKWSSTHTGNYIEYLSRIVSLADARDIYMRLLRGEPVALPVVFDLQQIRHKFRGVDNGWLPISV
jgi:hypothetical protein